MNLPEIKAWLKRSFPLFFRVLFALQRQLNHWFSEQRIPPLRKRSSSGIFVCYLTQRFPQHPATRQEHAHGGAVKMTYLAEEFPHVFPSANLLYTVSSVGHWAKSQIVTDAKRKRIRIIVNQNGVAYPAWHGDGWEATNESLKQILDQADYILYQSHFCQSAAEHFLLPPNVPFEIVYNPVDIEHFVPTPLAEKPKNLSLLLGGNQYEQYRFELALRTFKEVLKEASDARLMVTGNLWQPEPDALIYAKGLLSELGISDRVTLMGTYTQEQAPSIFSQAHVLLHTKYNDPSPTIILEALSSGLPIVYIKNGGVPELVGAAGVGLPVENSWEQIHLPDPKDMGVAVLEVMSHYSELSSIARERAVREFSLDAFISKHRQIFMKVLDA
jgi:glycosyltransferase involved in cell wall biosynthesis